MILWKMIAALQLDHQNVNKNDSRDLFLMSKFFIIKNSWTKNSITGSTSSKLILQLMLLSNIPLIFIFRWHRPW